MRAHVSRNARPCVRLARFATRLTRKASARASSRGSADGSACAAEASGSRQWPACHSASRRNRRRSAGVRTSPCWVAASRPPEWTKLPVGSAESESWSINQDTFMDDGPSTAVDSPHRDLLGGQGGSELPPCGGAEGAGSKSGALSAEWSCRANSGLKQRVQLREAQPCGRLAAEQPPVRAHFVRLRIDRDGRERVVQLHVALAELPAPAHGHDALAEAQLLHRALRDGALGDEGDPGGSRGSPHRAEH